MIFTPGDLFQETVTPGRLYTIYRGEEMSNYEVYLDQFAIKNTRTQKG